MFGSLAVSLTLGCLQDSQRIAYRHHAPSFLGSRYPIGESVSRALPLPFMFSLVSHQFREIRVPPLAGPKCLTVFDSTVRVLTTAILHLSAECGAQGMPRLTQVWQNQHANATMVALDQEVALEVFSSSHHKKSLMLPCMPVEPPNKS